MFRHMFMVLCFLACAGLPILSYAYVPFVTAEQVTAVKAKAQTDLDAKKALLMLTRQADRAVLQSIKIPTEYGGLPADYVCPDHNTLLSYEEKSGAHRCPVDNKAFTGEKYAAAQRYYVHMKTSRTVKDVALAYTLTGDKKYAAAGRSILLQYAKAWPAYNNPNNQPHGHIFWQLADEAQFTANIAWGYNLIHPTLTTDERQTIETELLTPLYKLMLEQQPAKVGTERVWADTAVALLGFAAGKPEWYKPAIDGPLGLKEQLQRGVLATGLWADGSLDNHFSVLTAIVTVGEISPHFGYDLSAEPNLKVMFSAPLLTIATADQPAAKSTYTDLYELAYTWYKDPLFFTHLTSSYAGTANQADRLSYRSLLYGLPLTGLPVAVGNASLAPVSAPAAGSLPAANK